MAIIGTAYVQVRAEDKHFEADVRAAARRIKNVNIQLKADVDMSKASKKIRDLRYRITSKDAVLKVDADVTKADARMAKLLSKFLSNDLEFNAVANTGEANSELSKLRDRFSRNRSNFTADADTAKAKAQLDWAARNRTASISARLDPSTSAALKGMFNTLTGTIPYEKIRAVLSGVAANFEGIAVKGTALVSVLGAISAELLVAGANILSVGGDITQAIGIVAMFPAALGGMISIMAATKMAWSNFGKAFSKDAKKSAEALSKLPTEAQNTVKALKGVYEQVQKPVQKAFWVSMGTSLQDTVKRLLPALKDGFVKVGGSLGKVTKEVTLAFGRLGDGTLQKMFEHLAKFLDNLAPGMGRLTDAFNILGKVGATYLPQFGTYLTGLATKFKTFIVEAEKTGKINDWIETGARRLQEMGSIVKSTAGIFSGLTKAARVAGAPGLTEMAASLRNIRDTVQGEPFQTQLVNILEGARTGAEQVGKGFKTVTSLIGKSSAAIGIFLGQAGRVAGLTFESITSLFDGTGLGAGLYTAMTGLEDALKELQPGFADLGSSIGSLGEIAGAVIREMAPGLNQLFDTVDKILASIKQGVLDALPVFNQFIQAILAVAQGPIVTLTTQIGNMLTSFSKLPGSIQTVMMSLGLFLLLKGRFAGFFSGIGKSLRDETTTAGRSFSQIKTGASQMRSTVKTEFTSLGRVMSGAMFEATDGMKKNFKVATDAIPAQAKSMFSRVSGDLRGAGAELVRSMSIKPWLTETNDGFRNLKTTVGQSLTGMVSVVQGKFSEIGRAIVPVGSAVDRIGAGAKDMASQMHGNLAPARTAFSMLGTHVKDVSKNLVGGLTSGVKTALGGLTSALGGPWGIAIMGATMLLGDYAQKAAEAKEKVDEMASTLDKVSGASTAATRELITNNLSVNKSFAGIKMDSAFDIAKKLGISLKDVNDAAQGVPGSFDKINTQLENSGKGVSVFGQSLKYLKDLPTIGPLASWIKDAGLFQTEGDKLNDMIGEQIKLEADAKKKIDDLAAATGQTSIQAAALSRNYATLADTTASANDKFAALKQNLEINSKGLIGAKNSTRDFAESMFNVTDGIKSVASENKGLIEGTGKLTAAFQKTLLNADGTFSTASRGAIDFSKQMDGARDAILKSGADELKRLQDLGVEGPKAVAGALKKMETGSETLRTTLKNLGIQAPMINQIMGQLGLDPDKLRGAIQLDTKDAEGDAMRLQIMIGAITSKNWSVALAATNDDVKTTLLKTDAMKKAYETGGWTAVVDVINKGKIPMEDFMLKLSQAKNASDVKKILEAAFPGEKILDTAQKKLDGYNQTPASIKEMKGVDNASVPAANATKGLGGYNAFAVLTKGLNATNNTGAPTKAAQNTMDTLTSVTRALFGENKTKPAVDAASGTIRGLNGKTVDLKANDGVTPIALQAKQSIDNVQSKTVDILTIFRTQGTPGAPAYSGPLARPTSGPGSMFGSLIPSVTNTASLLSGQFPMKYFANGGVENHVAQISKGQTPYRVWSEPETGGEAYIPLSKAKRGRSMKILEEVAKMFGMSLIKVKGFANGGTVGGSSSSVGSSASLPTSGNVPAALLRSITQSLLKDNNGLNNIGQNIVDGIIGGVNNKRGAAVTAMKVLSNDLENTVRTELDIHSPSKAFLALGKYIVDGLAAGIKVNGGAVLKNMSTLTNRLFVAASDVAKATGRSTASSINLINANKRLNASWSKMAPAKYTDQIVDYYQKTGRTGNRTLFDMVRARDDVVFRLNAANARLKTQTAAYADVVKDVESKMRGEFKLGSSILTETQPYVPEMKFSDVKTYSTGVLGRLRTFNSKLQALRKKGVAPALINEVAQLGSSEGIAMADALLSGSSADIKGLNSDVSAISSISHSIGISTADGMYKAGLDATRGLVKGLVKDRDSLTRAATQISNTLIGTVKRNLGIRSPSRVFAQLGRYTTEGYIVGLDQMQPKLDSRVDSLINVVPRRTPLSMKNTSATSTASTATNALSAAPAAPAVIQVLPSAGMDEVAVGQAAVRELNWQMLSR